MYQSKGTYYTEEHSVSFGDLIQRSSGGATYTDFSVIANSWRDWYLIPSSRPSIEHPTANIKYIEIPGSDGMIDLTDYLTGSAQYGMRTGSLSFFIDNGHENHETIRENMMRVLHGKKIKMRLDDDPDYYYDGRFTVGKLEPGASHSSISIGYQVDPYKWNIQFEGTSPKLWDTFNFEKDYDYSTVMYPNITVATGETKTIQIFSGDCSFHLTVEWVSGSVTASFGGVTRVLTSAGTAVLGQSTKNGYANLVVSGNGAIKALWRGGSL